MICWNLAIALGSVPGLFPGRRGEADVAILARCICVLDVGVTISESESVAPPGLHEGDLSALMLLRWFGMRERQVRIFKVISLFSVLVNAISKTI